MTSGCGYSKSDFISVALLGKKPRKDDVFMIVSKIADMVIAGDPVAIDKWDALAMYSYFMPTSATGKRLKDPEQWVSSITDKPSRSDTCLAFNHVTYSDGKKLYGTNGYTMFVADTDRPQGIYAPYSLERIKNGPVYPDINRIIGDKEFEYCGDLRIEDLKLREWDDPKTGKTNLVVYSPKGMTGEFYPFKVVKQAYNGAESMRWSFIDEIYSLAKLEAPGRTVYMMPIANDVG